MEANRLTYEKLIESGREILQKERAVILDATFRRSSDRKALSEMAKLVGVEVRWIECDLSPEVVRARLEKRLERMEGLSDATWETYERQQKEFEPLPGEVLKLNTGSRLVDVAHLATDWLREKERGSKI